MRKIILFFIFSVFCQSLFAQGNSGIDISLENVQFPDSVSINQTAVVNGYLKNNGNSAYVGNIILNFDIEDEMPIDFDLDTEIDEVSNLPNSLILPGDSIYFQRVFIIDSTRFNDRTVDLIVIWPTLISPDDVLTNNRSIKSFYVEEEASPLSEGDDNKGPNGNAYGYNNGNAYGHNNNNGNGNGNGGGRFAGFDEDMSYNEVVNSMVITNSFFQIQLKNEYLIQELELFDISGKTLIKEKLNLNSLQYLKPNSNQLLLIRLTVLNSSTNVVGIITQKL